MEKNTPIETFKDGTVKAAVFERDAEGPKGKFVSKSVALQISYTNKEGKWINKNLTIVKNNLARVQRVLAKAGALIGASLFADEDEYEQLEMEREAELQLRKEEEQAEWRIDEYGR